MKHRQFFLLIKPNSYNCNLCCDYCFYLCKESLYQDKKTLKMSDKVLQQIIRSYLKTNQQQYNICWQGGEPTMMGLPFYQKAVQYQIKYGHKGAIIANALQTNATLFNDEWAAFLKKYNFLVGVSLDGPMQMHDKYRKTRQQQGSHKAVIKGIEYLKSHAAAYNLLVLVNASNVNRAKELYQYLTSINCAYLQFTPCVEFKPDGTVMPYAITGKQWGKFLCEVFDLWVRNDIGKISIRQFDAILETLIYGWCSLCTMGKDCSQYFVVEHNGDVYPCDFFVEEKRKLGNIMENSWDELLDKVEYEQFKLGKQAWHITCNMCPYVKFCHGDCQKNRFYGSEETDNPSWLCEGWKMFFEHALPTLKVLAKRYR